MRSRIRLFALVGIVATAVDIGVLLALQDRSIWAANLVALLLAAIASYFGNRLLTFRNKPNARWVRHPVLFTATAVLAGAADMVVLVGLDYLDVWLWLAKVLAIAVAASIRWLVYRWILFGMVRRDLGEVRKRPASEGDYRLTIVIPAYNEGSAITSTLEVLKEVLEPTIGAAELELLVVDDGSTDETADLARAAGATVLEQPKNMGKGAAIRAGMLAANGRSVVFTDADLAYPAAMVLRLLEQLELGWDVVVGSRRHEETTTLVKARLLRELGGRMVNWLTHLVLLGHFRDTQCGIKGFRGDIGRVIFERTKVNGFAFDVEIFLIAEQDRLSLTEVPVSVENRQGSSVRLVADTANLLIDLIRIRRAAGWGWYRPSPAQLKVIENVVPDTAVPSDTALRAETAVTSEEAKGDAAVAQRSGRSETPS